MSVDLHIFGQQDLQLSLNSLKQKKARRDVLPTRRAKLRPQEENGAYNVKMIPQRQHRAYFFVQTRAGWLAMLLSNRGKWNRKRRAAAKLHLTSFEYGSIFMSGGRGSRFEDKVLTSESGPSDSLLFGGTYNRALRGLQLTHRGAGPNPFEEPTGKPQDRGADDSQYQPKLPIRIKTCLP